MDCTYIKTLLVDDHHIVRDGIKALLYKIKDIKVVAEASNGIETIAVLKQKHGEIDVVIMDIKMPEMDGIESTSYICEHFPGVNVLALTMHDDEVHIIKMIQEGALGYVLKTTNRSELETAIRTVAIGETYFTQRASRNIINYLAKEKNPKKSSATTDKWKNIGLTNREYEILKLITDEYTNIEIADKLHLSSRTIDTHRRNMLQKLNVKNTAGLVKFAMKHELV